jgi:hypothetical protein
MVAAIRGGRSGRWVCRPGEPYSTGLMVVPEQTRRGEVLSYYMVRVLPPTGAGRRYEPVKVGPAGRVAHRCTVPANVLLGECDCPGGADRFRRGPCAHVRACIEL